MEKQKVFKSVKIPKADIKAIEKIADSYPNKDEAAKYFGVSRQVLCNTIARGSGNSDTVKKILDKLKPTEND